MNSQDMFSEEFIHAGVCYPQGFSAAGVRAGIKKSGNLDLALIHSEKLADVAGVFTTNQVAAAPVHVSKKVVAAGKAHAICANAGCANACTGETGDKNARLMQEITAKNLNCSPDEVIIGSTGIIGVNLPMDKVEQGIEHAAINLSKNGSQDAGNAIVTTDTYSKSCACEIDIDGKKVRFGAIAKGSGMIQPNMATMLCYITTDASIEQKLLQEALSEITNVTFNMISIDGDMSTNDMVIVMANGAAENARITEKNSAYELFYSTLLDICTELSKRIASDGEGATKFLTIDVINAKSFEDAKTVGMSVAKSPLVKTAFFGEDPNWGRVICAVGYANVPIDPKKVVVKFGSMLVYNRGVGVEFDLDAMREVMSEHDILIEIDLNEGDSSATVWTCDFSYGYVKINGEYHT